MQLRRRRKAPKNRTNCRPFAPAIWQERPESDAKCDPTHTSLAVQSSCTATFRHAGPLCLFLPTGCSQRHALLGGLLIRRPHTSLEFARDHAGLHLFTRERLQSADVFLRPRTQFRRLRHCSSLIHYGCRPSVAVSKPKEPRICGALAPLYSITNKMPNRGPCGYAKLVPHLLRPRAAIADI